MDQNAFIEYENLCNAVFGNTGNGNTPQAREALERISLNQDFVEKSEVIFTNSRNNFALMNAGSSLTRLLTDYWTSYDNDQKLRIRDFILKYLIDQGQNLPPYLVSCLSKLVCRITSLSWLSDQRHRNILTQMLDYTKSREHCILALQILEELVGEINPNNHSKLSESKTATEFRESNLQNIIGLAFNLLNDTYNSDDNTIGSPELRMQLFDHSLTLLLACFSFDCKSSHYDYSNDNLPSMMLPEGWLSFIITESNISLLYSIYQRCSAPVSTHVLEVLLWIWCNPHLDSFMYSSDWKAYEQFLKGMMMIAEQQQGLNEVENVHVFCQLLNRIMTVTSIRRFMSSTLIPLINLLLPFTETLLRQYLSYNNSIPYLMRFWVHVTAQLHRANSAIVEQLNPVILNIVEMYISVHLESAEMMVDDRDDDPLNAMEVVQEELECVGKMIRVQLAEGVNNLCKRWDSIYKEYSNDLRTLSSMRMTGNIDPQLQYRKTLNECKLSWLIHIMGQVLIGQKFTTVQIEQEEELRDAEYSKLVFGLSHSIVFRTMNENSPKVDPRLELALLSFFRSFRETFSAMTTIASTEGLSGSALISGVQQTAYNLFFERLAVGDFTSVMNTIVEKICSNLRFWGNDVGVVSASLKLFLDMSKGYQGSRMLLQLESIEFMLQNHTEATFRFLAIPDLLPFRTLYYSTLTKLILMDNIPGRLEMFVVPFADMLDRMNNMPFSSPQVVVDCMKMYKDLRGVMLSCNNSRSYNIVYEALSQKAFQLMEKTLQCYPQNDLLIATMLKCLLAFVDNQEPRVDSGKTSTNGITLFKSSSTILMNTVNVISQYNANFNTAPESMYRNIRLVLEVFNRSLTGKYVPFGVFLLYDDHCLLTSLEMCMKMILTIPQEQVEKRQKLEKAIFSFIDILFTDHIETLSQMNSSSFISIIQAVVHGLESYDGETVKKCADSIDRFATYFYLNKSRNTPTMTRLNSIIQATPTLWKELFDKIMELLLFKQTVDILSRPIHSIFLVDKSVADYFYEKLSATQTPEVVEKLKDAMVQLTTNLDQTLEPIIRDQFCERCRKFKEVSQFLIL